MLWRVTAREIAVKYTQYETEHEVRLVPRETAVASVILLHGLGADGWDFVPIVAELELPDSLPLRFVFPHAPLRPVTINNGYEMRAWFDITDFSPEGRADATGLAESSRRAAAYVDREIQAGITASQVVLAGFSQGGAVALDAGLRYPQRLAGIVALSSYLPFAAALAAGRSVANAELPVLLCHGRADPVVPFSMGIESRDALRSMGCPVEWRDYPMQHQVCADELTDVSGWLRARLVPLHGPAA